MTEPPQRKQIEQGKGLCARFILKFYPMKQIANLNVGHLPKGAHFLYMTNVVQRMEADTEVKEKVKDIFAALSAALVHEGDCSGLTRKSAFTDGITEADRQRGIFYSSYKKVVRSYRALKQPEMARAARELWQHIKDFGIRPRMQLDEETSLLIRFTEDLLGPFAPQVSLLSLTSFVNNMKAANDTVHALTIRRIEERMARGGTGVYQKARRATDLWYRQLVTRLNALAIVEGDALYADFIDETNTEIVHYKQEVL